ncbi:MAG: MBL fold metallo-hydrolase [Ruminococcaceae bacterium]|nr:MBL fold metallo-hydrolase [Oscillospiraceae bacterium]
MELQVLCVPPLGTNCYFIKDNNDIAIVDPGGDADSIIELIENNGFIPRVIPLTHGHFDHTGAAGKLKMYFSIPIFIHYLDAPMLTNAETSHATRFGFPYTGCQADRLLKDGDTFAVGNATFSVLHTPGHTPGSSCFLSGDTLISGDTLFRGSIGRFERENKNTMKESVRRLLSLDESIRVFPGHEGATTIGTERRTNPFAKFNWEWE